MIKTTTESIKERFRMQTRQSGDTIRLMRFFLISLTSAVVMLVAGCQGRGETPITLYEVGVINLEYSELPSVPIDSVVTNVRFVPLETNRDCLIESYDEIQVVDEKIFVRSSGRSQQALFVFDIDGSHLLTIDAEGRGPGEYMALRGFYVLPERQEIGLLDAFAQILVYDYKGNYLRSYSFQSLGVLPCEDLPGITRFNDLFYMNVMTFETAGADPNPGWGSELMEDNLFNFVAVYNFDWSLMSRTYPIPKERSMQHFRYQLTAGGQKTTFVNDGERLWFHSIFSDYLYEVVGDKFIPRYFLDYGRHRIPEKEHKEIIKTHAWQAPDYLFALMNSNLGFPGARFTVRGSRILFQPQIGRMKPLMLYDSNKGQSILISMTRNDIIGNMPNLYPVLGVDAWEGGFYGHVPADRLVRERERGREHCVVSPLSPVNFPDYNKLSRDDNAVMVFFDFKEEIIARIE